MELICQWFKKVKEFARIGQMTGGYSRARVKVKNCDVKFIPYFLPLVDIGGVVYPIRILLDTKMFMGLSQARQFPCIVGKFIIRKEKIICGGGGIGYEVIVA